MFGVDLNLYTDDFLMGFWTDIWTEILGGRFRWSSDGDLTDVLDVDF